MERQSAYAHREYRQSSEKFDYFITGVSIAICGYLIQTFDSSGLMGSSLVPKLEFTSIFLFILSIYFGIRRIENIISGKRLNYSYLRENEKIGDMSKSVVGGKTITIDGKVADKNKILAHIKESDERIKILTKEMNDKADRTGWYYRARGALFISGIVVQFIAQIALGTV